MFRGIGAGFMRFFRWLGRNEKALGVVTVVTVVVLAVWFVLSLLDVNIVLGKPQTQTVVVSAAPTASAQTTPTPAATQAATGKNPPAATETFMTGQVNGNADQVWNAMSATLHNRLAGAGQDKDYFKTLFERQRQSGLTYERYEYVGGAAAENGNSIHFYVLDVLDSDKKKARIPWTFILDRDGKIVSLESVAP
jgi:hypothetical protein